MPEEEMKIFTDFADIYRKWRSRLMENDDDWIRFTTEVCTAGEQHNWEECPLANRMANMLLDVFSDMYRNGKQPEMADYFGRSDLL